MQLTKEVLDARRKSLLEQFNKLSLERSAIIGAIQDTEFWIEQLEKPDGGDLSQA